MSKSLIVRAFNKVFGGWMEQIRLARLFKKHDLETKYFLVGDQYEIGDFTYGWPDVWVYDSNLKLKIGKYTDMGKDVKFMLGGNHHVEWISDFAFYKYSNFKNYKKGWTQQNRGGITVGNDVWIGREALILSGVTIGDGAVIGARAVVAKDIPPYAIAVGNPARVIKYRFSDDEIKKLLEIQWWNWPVEKVDEYVDLLTQGDVAGFINVVEINGIGGG